VRVIRTATVAAAAAAAAAAVGTAATGTATARHTAALRLEVTEWAVVPSAGLIPAGRVRITVANVGVLRHQLVIAHTRRWGDAQPQARRGAVGEPLLVKPGATAAETVTLTPGSYVAYDDLPAHAAARAAVAFSVR
jgi:hypothetical protein